MEAHRNESRLPADAASTVLPWRGDAPLASRPADASPFRDPAQPELIGVSRAMRDLNQEIARVARSDAKVLITGESGVGKEVVARLIHARSPRRGRAFIAVNCAGVPDTLLESELFGHVKGSFTGAHRDTTGKLETAHLGTIFLDEVGEMTLHMQTVLLRFLETGELQRVGGDGRGRRVDVRVVAATNRNLQALMRAGAFREDLYYRLNVIHVSVPPLRDRPEDVPLLVAHFVDRLGRGDAAHAARLDDEAVAALATYAWPGNVRELENVVERMIVTAERGTIGRADVEAEIAALRADVVTPPRAVTPRAAHELYARMREGGESFWKAVYPMFIRREIARDTVRDVVRLGLEDAQGNYRVLVSLFNLRPGDYKRFLNFLKLHDCHVPFREFRVGRRRA